MVKNTFNILAKSLFVVVLLVNASGLRSQTASGEKLSTTRRLIGTCFSRKRLRKKPGRLLSPTVVSDCLTGSVGSSRIITESS
jgi:hypothetical protein